MRKLVLPVKFPFAVGLVLFLKIYGLNPICADPENSTSAINLRRGHWVNFSAEEGYLSGGIWDIFQDQGGNYWFATYDGVRRYDGEKWTTFTTDDGLPSNAATSITQDREGTLWVATIHGVGRYDGEQWTTFTTDDGLASNNVRTIMQDREGSLWFGYRGSGASRYDGKHWTHFTKDDGLANNFVYEIFQDRSGNYWFGTLNGGVSKYDGHSWQTFTTENGLANDDVWHIFQDREGFLWFATRGGGASRYDGHHWFTFRPKGGMWSTVHGDEAKLRQVLINLLGNAVKFTKEGEVALRLVRLLEHHYGFEVRDTGPGMTREEQEKIFQPFQQGEAGMRQGGTGLGLTISQRQLGLMGSALKVDSEVGKGSRFSFAVELPPAQGALHAEGPRTWGQVQRLAAGFSVKALLADDVAENREILSGMLGELGVEVEMVENGQQALEKIEASLPHIVFLDIRMPVLDGLAAMRLIQENALWAQVKVVAVSASVLEHERQEYLQAGFDDFIDKPFRFERICECLAQQLRVEFEYGEVEEGAPPEAEIDWSEVALPAALVERLKKAAEFYNVTQIEGYLKEMEGLGEGPKKLASHLRSLRLRHDMEGIVEVLAAVSHE